MYLINKIQYRVYNLIFRIYILEIINFMHNMFGICMWKNKDGLY